MKKKREVTVAKGVKVSRGKEEKLKEKKGGSNTGRYKTVNPKEFAGKAGGTSKYSFPINNIKHARSALSYAHYAPNPEGIRNAVYKRFPQLKKRKLEQGKK
jgi:hypothetical protein